MSSGTTTARRWPPRAPHLDELAALNKTLPELPRRLDAGLDLGGYFLKDRLWFFGAYDRVQSDQDYSPRREPDVPGVGTSYQQLHERHGRDADEPLLGEADAPRRPLAVRSACLIFGDPGSYTGRKVNPSLHVVGNPGPDSAILANAETGGTDVSAKWDGLFGSHFAVQLQYGYHEEKNRQTSDYPDTIPISQYARRLHPAAAGFGQPATRGRDLSPQRLQGSRRPPFSATTRSRPASTTRSSTPAGPSG